MATQTAAATAAAATTSQHRERRAWTDDEDRALLNAIATEDPGATPPSKWHAIATRVPGRTNKDCRKRWWAQMAGQVSKGAWSQEEDDRLTGAVKEVGQKWALVAQRVGTRNSGQCAKRWTDALDPAINRNEWTDEEDVKLLEAVKDGGKQWATIVRTHLNGRTGLSAKNRYNHLIRTSGERAAGRDRRKNAAAPYVIPHGITLPDGLIVPKPGTPININGQGQPQLPVEVKFEVLLAPPEGSAQHTPSAEYDPAAHTHAHQAMQWPPPPGALAHLPPPGLYPPSAPTHGQGGSPVGAHGESLSLQLPPLRGTPQDGGSPMSTTAPQSAVHTHHPQHALDLQHLHHHLQAQQQQHQQRQHQQHQVHQSLPPPTGPAGPQGPQLPVQISREHTPTTPHMPMVQQIQTQTGMQDPFQWAQWHVT